MTDKLIDSVQNGVHLYRIRDALSRGHATVMIGAGFSRNASGGQRLPGWRALVDGLLRDLYPSEEIRAREGYRFSGTSGSLRLAQEYAAVLGRAQLDARLHDLLPDEGATEPGRLHTRLLSLPWADVFTTNYDTLLERTLEVDRRHLTPSIQRRYQIVRTSSDLPFSRSNGAPRIVKLHGTLRASAPLIITEEDYRCYPREHAPFVNMVQQSMLENVFCLLGFSGDDPNFIEWSGWTRDRLGPHAPPIYLITLAPVPEGQRLILEERKIFPIPIGTLAGENSEDWVQSAFSALLDFWHGQPPPRPAAWGDGYRIPSTFDRNLVGQLIEWTLSARDVRGDYPGWLVAPERNRERVASRCGALMSRVIYQKIASSMSPELRLAYLFEVNWILETTLTPLTRTHVNEYEAALTEFGREKSSHLVPHDFTEALSYDPVETQQHWDSLAVALVRYSRENRDAAKFEFWKQELLLRASGGRDSEALRWMRYEETLFQLENFKHDEARETLENWYVDADTADPYWLVRAGALFGELGDSEQGRHLAQAGLHKIRAAIQTDGETTYLVSREHWAELILRVASDASEYSDSTWKNRQRARSPELPRSGAIEDGPSSSMVAQRNIPTPPTAIPRKAQARESADHPEHQIELIEREFGRFAKILSEATFNFDDPEVALRHHRVSVSNDALAAAVSYIKMVEMSGYVPRFGELGLSARTMIEAFIVLSTANPVESTIRVLLRVNATDRFVSLDALTRENVARLSANTAENIVNRAFALADAHLGNGRNSHPAPEAHKAIFALELISRLLYRLDQTAALNALRKFIDWHDLPSVQQEHGLHEHFKDYFHRVLRALRPEVVTSFLPTLIALKPEPDTLSRMSRWPRVVQDLMSRIPVDVSQKEWSSVADGALSDARLARDNETMMAFHLGRLDWLVTHQLLSVSQSRALAALVWGSVPTRTLPATVPGFYHGALLTWPAPPLVDKQSIFKSWILTQPLTDIVKRFEEDGVPKRSITPPQETLLTNILLTRNVKDVFSWTSNELLTVVGNLRAWWIREGRQMVGEAAAESGHDFSRPHLIRRLRLLGHVLQRVVTPDMSRDAALAASIPEWLSEMWEASRQLGAPMPQFLFAALHWWPDRTSIVLRIATESIASATEVNFTTAMHAAGHWLIRNPQPSAASRQYISLLVNAIALRLDGRLDAVLTSICELLTLGTVEHFRFCVDTLFPTLRGLLEELQGYEYDSGFVDVESRAQLRQRTMKTMTLLVGAFPALDGNDWKRCQELAAADPLVDVRNLSRVAGLNV